MILTVGVVGYNWLTAQLEAGPCWLKCIVCSSSISNSSALKLLLTLICEVFCQCMLCSKVLLTSNIISRHSFVNVNMDSFVLVFACNRLDLQCLRRSSFFFLISTLITKCSYSKFHVPAYMGITFLLCPGCALSQPQWHWLRSNTWCSGSRHSFGLGFPVSQYTSLRLSCPFVIWRIVGLGAAYAPD